MQENDRSERIELAEERLDVAKREVERDRVVVRTRVSEREETAEVDLRHEDVDVERVPVGRVVDSPPATREEDGVLIVPVLEEELVVTTRLVLKEELRISRRSRTETVRRTVRLRTEHADVTRVDGPQPDPTNPKET